MAEIESRNYLTKNDGESWINKETKTRRMKKAVNALELGKISEAVDEDSSNSNSNSNNGNSSNYNSNNTSSNNGNSSNGNSSNGNLSNFSSSSMIESINIELRDLNYFEQYCKEKESRLRINSNSNSNSNSNNNSNNNSNDNDSNSNDSNDNNEENEDSNDNDDDSKKDNESDNEIDNDNDNDNDNEFDEFDAFIEEINDDIDISMIVSKFDRSFPFDRLSNKDCKEIILFVHNNINNIFKVFCDSDGRVMLLKVYFKNNSNQTLMCVNFEVDDSIVSQWEPIVMDQDYCLNRLKMIDESYAQQ